MDLRELQMTLERMYKDYLLFIALYEYFTIHDTRLLFFGRDFDGAWSPGDNSTGSVHCRVLADNLSELEKTLKIICVGARKCF
jgi:hypothetical protein